MFCYESRYDCIVINDRQILQVERQALKAYDVVLRYWWLEVFEDDSRNSLQTRNPVGGGARKLDLPAGQGPKTGTPAKEPVTYVKRLLRCT
jgi:hypothetical protein